MEENFDLMQEVYVRLEELEVKLEIEDMARITEVEERKGKFETSLFDAAAHIKAEKEEYIEQLNEQRKHMEDVCGEIVIELNENIYAEPGEEPGKVYESLLAVQERTFHQRDKASQFKEIDGLLSKVDQIAKEDVGPLANALALLDKRTKVWLAWSDWKDTYGKWLASDCRVFLNPEHPENETGFDGPQLEKAVEEFYQEESSLIVLGGETILSSKHIWRTFGKRGNRRNT